MLTAQTGYTLDIQEEAIISTIIYSKTKNNDKLDICIAYFDIRVEYNNVVLDKPFNNEIIRKLWNILIRLRKENNISYSLLIDIINKEYLKDKSILVKYINKIKDQLVDDETLEKFLQSIRKKQIIDAIKHISSQIDEGNNQEIESIIRNLYAELDRDIKENTDFKTIEMISNNRLQEICNREKLPVHLQEFVGYPTGIKELDERILFGGREQGSYITLGALPSTGKTAISLWWILNASKYIINYNRDLPSEQQLADNILFISLENSPESDFDRFFCMDTSTPGYTLRNIRMRPYLLKDNRFLQTISNKYAQWHNNDYARRIRIYDGDRKISTIERKIIEAVEKYNVKEVWIDFFTLITPDLYYHMGTEAAKYEAVSKKLQDLTRKYNITIVLLCQLTEHTIAKRKIDNREPVPSDIKVTKSVEEHADIMIFLHDASRWGLPHDYNLKNAIKIIIPKHRNGRAGVVYTRFNKPCIQFIDDYSYINKDSDNDLGIEDKEHYVDNIF